MVLKTKKSGLMVLIISNQLKFRSLVLNIWKCVGLTTLIVAEYHHKFYCTFPNTQFVKRLTSLLEHQNREMDIKHTYRKLLKKKIIIHLFYVVWTEDLNLINSSQPPTPHRFERNSNRKNLWVNRY